MPYADVRGIRVYHELHGPRREVEGTGTRVLLISGTGGDLRHSPDRGNGPLEQRFSVLMYDQRGLGRSDKPDVPCTMADYADDAAALLDVVGWDRCAVVGISFGGMVAQHLAIRHPERVERLVLACTSPGGEGGSSFDLRQLEGLTPEERRRRWLPLLDTRNDLTTDPPTLAPGLEAILAALDAGPLEEDPSSAVGARRQLEARAGHDAWEGLPSIRCPTLVIGGRYDAQAPRENLERLAERIPGALLELCEGGHVFFLQDPGAWPTIIAFLEEGARPADHPDRLGHPSTGPSTPG